MPIRKARVFQMNRNTSAQLLRVSVGKGTEAEEVPVGKVRS